MVAVGVETGWSSADRTMPLSASQCGDKVFVGKFGSDCHKGTQHSNRIRPIIIISEF